MARVLVIGDTHMPAMHPKYIGFLKKIEKKYKCNRVVHIGDSVDWCAISFHEKCPDMPSPKEEEAEAQKQMRKLYKAFPKLDYMIGNHSDLPSRKAKLVGLPSSTQVPFKELWDVPKWRIHDRYEDLEIDGVLYRHGDKEKAGSRLSALANAVAQHKPVVQGHFHAQFGIEFAANHERCIWGMQVGCGVLPGHPNMKYSKVYSARPILGCGVVINGNPYVERMHL